VTADGLTVAALCNRFLTAKHHKKESGELGGRMFTEYKGTTDLLVATFGANRLVDDLAADDFEGLRAVMAKRWGPVRLGNMITRVKSVFKYGTDNGLIKQAVRCGSEFRKPDKAVLRRHPAQAGEKMMEADQLCRRIEAAAVPLRAMILLGVNAGFGNHDVATLPMSAVNLDSGWLDFPRPKTGIPRRCPLWPETVAAIRAALAERLRPLGYEDCGRVFLNSRGTAFIRTTEKSHSDLIGVHFGDLLKQLGPHRRGSGSTPCGTSSATSPTRPCEGPGDGIGAGWLSHPAPCHLRRSWYAVD
jgi:integrase